ncbi:MAG: hypothetical protein J0M12_14375 [Deltaproteobacteria bacterium]|nr:hypothetical protein [Deltaproteobacteria bacterium]
MSEPVVAKKELVRVICEACQQKADCKCRICSGNRFYFWDAETLLCYNADGTPIVVSNEAGETIEVIRKSPQSAKNLELTTMLRFIELWVAEKSSRKWKLSIEKGWSCSVWPNRYKDKAQTFVSDDPERCVADCYKFIMTLIANPAD